MLLAPPESIDGSISKLLLNVELTSMVGRSRELEHLHQLVSDSSNRLIVLTGAGGVGKTRLALQLVRSLDDSLYDLVVPIDLEFVSDVDSALRYILRSLRSSSTMPADQVEAIQHALGERRCLLVLDTIEHIEAIGLTLVAILQRCPRLTILGTSRTVLGVSGERVVTVTPLAVPGATANTRAPEMQVHTDAVQLFEARARAVQPNFRVDDGNAESVALICRQLDGLPLAIELAAARMGIFSAETIATRIGDNFAILGDGPSNAPARQRTLDRTIAWSYELLSPIDRQMFRRLSLLRGNWTLDDAERYLTTIDGNRVYARIEALVNANLIRRHPGSVEPIRFSMLQIIRAYGQHELENAGELEIGAEARDEWALQFVSLAEPEYLGANQIEWLNRTDEIFVDLLQAFHHLRDRKRFSDALALASGLWRYGYSRDRFVEISELIAEALTHVPDRSRRRAHALNAAGFLERQAGRWHDLEERHAEAMSVAREVGEPVEVAQAHFGLGDLAMSMGDFRGAETHYANAASIYSSISNVRGQATAQINLGNAYRDLGLVERAENSFREALENYGRAEDRRGIAWATLMLAQIAIDRNMVADARTLLASAGTRLSELGDPAGRIELCEATADLAARDSMWGIAAQLNGVSHALRDKIALPNQPNDIARRKHLEDVLSSALGSIECDRQQLVGQRLSPVEVDTLIQHVLDHTAAAPASKHVRLTKREQEVLPLLCQGLPDRDIAMHLFLSPRTVSMHVSNILTKLDVASRAEAMVCVHRGHIMVSE